MFPHHSLLHHRLWAERCGWGEQHTETSHSSEPAAEAEGAAPPGGWSAYCTWENRFSPEINGMQWSAAWGRSQISPVKPVPSTCSSLPLFDWIIMWRLVQDLSPLCFRFVQLKLKMLKIERCFLQLCSQFFISMPLNNLCVTAAAARRLTQVASGTDIR